MIILTHPPPDLFPRPFCMRARQRTFHSCLRPYDIKLPKLFACPKNSVAYGPKPAHNTMFFKMHNNNQPRPRYVLLPTFPQNPAPPSPALPPSHPIPPHLIPSPFPPRIMHNTDKSSPLFVVWLVHCYRRTTVVKFSSKCVDGLKRGRPTMDLVRSFAS